jgi:NAD(P)-dependent dehydrogenase (short-subunit alcohol dehydrogenase family)
MQHSREQLTAVITGAGGDIGSAIAARLKRDGARIVLWDIDQDGLGRTKVNLDGDCTVGRVDLTCSASVHAAAAQLQRDHGDVDILVNAAGIVAPHAPTWKIDESMFRRVLDVNLVGVWNAIQALLPQLRTRQQVHGRSRIVNIASYLGSEPQGYDAAYAASKAGVIAFTKSLARELAAEGLLVNCVAPTVLENRMGQSVSSNVLRDKVRAIPLGRLARADDVAAMVAWLCSTDCSFSTGAIFDVTGGRAAR